MWLLLAEYGDDEPCIPCVDRPATGLSAEGLLSRQMEWVEGEIWGNVWQSECIVRIDPASGAVRGWILLEGLTARAAAAGSGHRIDVLNGGLAAPSTLPCARHRQAFAQRSN